jgi:hypothetical protein
MGLMMRRRRPLMRMAAGAAVAGTAYHMGKKGQQQADVNDQAQAAYAATQAPAPPPEYAPPPPSQPAAGGLTAHLDELAHLHETGVLTDEEFSSAKAKLLAS